MKYLLAMALCFSSIQLSNAEELLEIYATEVGSQDHFNSKGERLQNAAAIIRQDRANFHKFHKRDPQDEMDSFFSKPQNRAKIQRMLSNGVISKNTASKIINGTPTIVIYRYKSSIHVEVE